MVRDLECKLERGVMMMAKLKKMLTHLGKNESGQGALAIVIILLMLGAIIITPLLVFMNTGLKAGGVYESKLQEFYAADAGVEDGLWQIKNDKLSTLFASYPYDPYNYTANYSYPVAPNASGHEINAKNVTVNITNVWIPSNIPTPNSTVAESIIENGTLIVTSSVINFTGGRWGCQIKISYSWRGDDSNGTKLKIATIGAWLSGGCNYTSGSGNLSSYTPTCVPYCGGQAITWNKNPNETFKLPNQTGYPLVRTFNFNFTGPESPNPQALSWITTTGVDAIPYSWDADSKPYKIGSTAGSTTTEAYVIKNELRKLGAAISGDYVATGNSLLTPTGDVDYRDRLYKESSATIASGTGSGQIPPGATVEAAYLYWSGWIDYRYRYYYWGWREGTINALKYPANPTAENLTKLVKNATVNNVSFSIGNNMTEVTADNWQITPSTGDPVFVGSWYYCCFADVTSLVKGAIEAEEIGANGAAAYTLGHSNAVINQQRPESGYYYFDFYGGGGTGYPLGTPALEQSGLLYQRSYAGWSLVIIYSSPETKGHQLYLYDIKNPNFKFSEGWAPADIPDPDFDGDGNPGGTISGFLVPQPIGSETNAAKMTCFVGEGDEGITGDYFKVTGPSGTGAKLWDGITCNGNSYTNPNNVWNSKSVGLTVPGIDIDTFYVTWSSQILRPGDTWAQVDPTTGSDGFTLVYIILSFRSATTTGGTISYLIR
jgi:hypothetical protein